jgi:hypothetical protein
LRRGFGRVTLALLVWVFCFADRRGWRGRGATWRRHVGAVLRVRGGHFGIGVDARDMGRRRRLGYDLQLGLHEGWGRRHPVTGGGRTLAISGKLSVSVTRSRNHSYVSVCCHSVGGYAQPAD